MGESVALYTAVSGYGSPAAALPAASSVTPSADAMQVLTELSGGGLSREEITRLSAAVAQADAGISDAALRKSVLNEVSSLGMYFRNTDPEGFPRWPVLTALRAYGLNLASQGEGDAAVATKVRQILADVAAQSRGVTPQQAAAQVAPQPVVVKAPAVKTAGSGSPSGSGDSPSPAAGSSPAPVVKAVDQLV